jgi:hypothetical protein
MLVFFLIFCHLVDFQAIFSKFCHNLAENLNNTNTHFTSKSICHETHFANVTPNACGSDGGGTGGYLCSV